jgi:hypothetical protein
MASIKQYENMSMCSQCDQEGKSSPLFDAPLTRGREGFCPIKEVSMKQNENEISTPFTKNAETIKEELALLHDKLRRKLQQIKRSGWKPRPDQTFYNYKM